MSGIDLTGQQNTVAAQLASNTAVIMEAVNQKIQRMRDVHSGALNDYIFSPEEGLLRLGSRTVELLKNAHVITVQFGAEDVKVSFHDTSNIFRDHKLKAENTVLFAELSDAPYKAAEQIVELIGKTEPIFDSCLRASTPMSRRAFEGMSPRT